MSQFTVQMRDDIRKAIKEKKMKNNKKCTIPDCYGFIKNGTCNICLTIFCEKCYKREHLGACELSLLLPLDTKYNYYNLDNALNVDKVFNKMEGVYI